MADQGATAEIRGPVRVQLDGFRRVNSEVIFVDMAPRADGSYEPLVGYTVLESRERRDRHAYATAWSRRSTTTLSAARRERRLAAVATEQRTQSSAHGAFGSGDGAGRCSTPFVGVTRTVLRSPAVATTAVPSTIRL
jgi:hypothetical protein